MPIVRKTFKLFEELLLVVVVVVLLVLFVELLLLVLRLELGAVGLEKRFHLISISKTLGNVEILTALHSCVIDILLMYPPNMNICCRLSYCVPLTHAWPNVRNVLLYNRIADIQTVLCAYLNVF